MIYRKATVVRRVIEVLINNNVGLNQKILFLSIYFEIRTLFLKILDSEKQ